MIPYTVWGYREVPNSTIGVTPYMLSHGRLPKELFSILNDSGAGELELPPNLGKSVAAYLQELKENLEIAADFATKHARPSRRATPSTTIGVRRTSTST